VGPAVIYRGDMRVLPLLLVLGACKSPPPEAPTEMADISRYLFREFDNPEALPQGVLNLEELLGAEDITAEDPVDRAWQVAGLTAGDLEAITIPSDGDLDLLATMALAYRSPFPVDSHTAYMVIPDLTVISTTAVIYDRTFPGTDDASCFVDASCEVLATENYIDRETALFKMEYSFNKDYRWVELEDGRKAIVSRGWIEESAHGDSSRNHLWQNYETDVWIGREDGTTWRFYAVYTQAEYAGVGEDMAINLSRAQAQSALDTLDAYIEENQ